MWRPTLLPIDHWTKSDVGFSRMRVTSPYGWRGSEFHDAIDVGNARLGDVLVATVNGTVAHVGYLAEPWSTPKPSDAEWISWGRASWQRPSLWEGPTWGGQMVVIRSGNTWVSYAHCRSVNVRAGQSVRIGQQVGTIGESGSAYLQGHVHFMVIEASAEQLAILAGNRTYMPRIMTRDPWPLIAEAALTADLPDTSTEDTMNLVEPKGTLETGIAVFAEPNTEYLLFLPGPNPDPQSFKRGTYKTPPDRGSNAPYDGPWKWSGHDDGWYRITAGPLDGWFLSRNGPQPELRPDDPPDCSAIEAKVAAQTQAIATLKTNLATANSKISAAKAALS